MGGGTELALVDGRAPGLERAAHPDQPAGGRARPLAGLGRHAAAAALDRPERGHRDDLLERDHLGARKPSLSVSPSTPFPPESLVEEGRRLIEYLHAKRRVEGAASRLASSRSASIPTQFQFAFAVAEGAIKGKTKGQYPAPLVALKAIRDGCNLPLEEGLKVEQKAFQELHGSPIMANLIAIFFMKNRLSRDPGVSDPAVDAAGR